MTNPYLDSLEEALEKTHGLKATYLETVPVTESFQGKPVWAGEVEVFAVAHPKTNRAYAWGYQDNGQLQCVAVLGIPPVNGPLDAVKAYLMSKVKGK